MKHCYWIEKHDAYNCLCTFKYWKPVMCVSRIEPTVIQIDSAGNQATPALIQLKKSDLTQIVSQESNCANQLRCDRLEIV